jgi:hypothetical protein
METVQFPEVLLVLLVLLPPLVWPLVLLTYLPLPLVTLVTEILLVPVPPVPSPTVSLALLPMSVLLVLPVSV